jgi:hypothetical protein
VKIGAAKPELMKIPSVQRIIAHRQIPAELGRAERDRRERLPAERREPWAR